MKFWMRFIQPDSSFVDSIRFSIKIKYTSTVSFWLPQIGKNPTDQFLHLHGRTNFALDLSPQELRKLVRPPSLLFHAEKKSFFTFLPVYALPSHQSLTSHRSILILPMILYHGWELILVKPIGMSHKSNTACFSMMWDKVDTTLCCNWFCWATSSLVTSAVELGVSVWATK